MTQKIVLIAGIGHSGSTILDMSMGCHPEVIGLGEVSKVLRTPLNEFEHRYEKGVCSCGETPVDCPYWGPVLNDLKARPDRSVEKKYDEMLPRFQEQFGQDRVLFDSSKTVRPFMAHLHKHYDVRVIFLVRDLRSWIHSRQTREGGGTLRLMLRWWRGNQRTLRFLHKHRMNFLTLGYEELALYPREMLNKVCSFTEIDFREEMLKPADSKSHIIRGNAARTDKDKVSEIRYDARWMTSIRLMVQSLLLLPALWLNRKLVYSNFITGKSRAFGNRQHEVMIFGNRRKEVHSEALKSKQSAGKGQ